jgi:surface antigen
MGRKLVLILAVCLALFFTAGCATRAQTGAVIGGAAGAMAGSAWGTGPGRGHMGWGGPRGGNLATIVIGAAIGGAIGAIIGREMDQQDRLKTAQVLEYNRTGEASTWVNPDKQTAYTVTPTQTHETAQGPCREFRTQANIGGKVREVYGTACRQADGSWKIVK